MEEYKVKSRKPKETIRLDTISSLLGWQYYCKPEAEVVDDMVHQEEVNEGFYYKIRNFIKSGIHW